MTQAEPCLPGDRPSPLKGIHELELNGHAHLNGQTLAFEDLVAAKSRVEAAVHDLAHSLRKAQSDLAVAAKAMHGAHPEGSQEAAHVAVPKWTSYGLLPHEEFRVDEEALDIDEACEHELLELQACDKYETLCGAWPRSLEIRQEVLVLSAAGDGTASVNVTRISSSQVASPKAPRGKRAFRSASSMDLDFGFSDDQKQTSCVLHPDSVFNVMYHLCSVSILMFDIITIPIIIAWDIPIEGQWFYAAWVTTAFWTLDICLCFVTAFYLHGDLIVCHRDIARNYMRSWFLPDVIVCASDWITLAVTSSSQTKLVRLTKLGRLVRLFSLFRFLKFMQVLERSMETHLPSWAKTMFAHLHLAKVFAVTLVYTHVISSMWHFIGMVGVSDTGARWIDVVQVVGDSVVDFQEQSMMYQYATSFHWAIAQITLGAMEIPCTTSLERAFCVVCLLLGLLFGSTVFATLSATMLELQMDKKDFYAKMKEMRRYLRENNVHHKIVVMVERQLAERLNEKEKVREDEVAGLSLLSTQLRSELHFNIVSPLLNSHSLFRLWIGMDMEFARRFARKCTRIVYLRNHDELFRAGQLAEAVHYFLAGNVTYFQEPQTSHVDEPVAQQVPEGTWLAQAALWSHWIHVGTATSGSMSEALEITLDEFTAVLPQATYPVQRVTQDYCHSYHRRLQSARPPSTEWPDDVQVPFTDWDLMVANMPQESQTVIGLSSLAQQGRSQQWKMIGMHAADKMDKLAEEVKVGKSTVMLDSFGEIQRVASIVALKISNDDDKILVQLAKQDNSQMVASCQLPGGKQDRAELVTDTVERILQSKMGPIANSIEVTSTEREIQWKESKEFGVPTKYIRNVCNSRLVDYQVLEGARIGGAAACCGSDSPGNVGKDFMIAAMSAPSQGLGKTMSAATPSKDYFVRMLKMADTFRINDSKGKPALYGWLQESDFELMKGSVGEEAIGTWLSVLAANEPLPSSS